jgi:hypothetical protein
MPRSESANCKATRRTISLTLALPHQNRGAMLDGTSDRKIFIDF